MHTISDVATLYGRLCAIQRRIDRLAIEVHTPAHGESLDDLKTRLYGLGDEFNSLAAEVERWQSGGDVTMEDYTAWMRRENQP